MQLSDDLAAQAASQLGMLTRGQLRGGGVTAEALRWRLGRTWSLVLPTVVSTTSRPLSPSQKLVAALLEAGPDAVVTGHHACAWHGVTSARTDRPVEVLLPTHHAARGVGFVRVRRTRRPDARPVRRGGLTIASRPRAVVDAARASRTDDEALAIVLEAVQRRLVTVEQLEHEVEAGATRGSARPRRAVRSARAGAWSVPEAALLRLCATSRVLPAAYPNPQLETRDGAALVSPDVWFDDVALAVMVHSRAHHSRDLDWEGTVERDGELVEHGVVVIGFTPASIAREGQRVLRRVERAYLGATSDGRRRPPVRMLPRGWGLLTGDVRG